MLLLVAGIFALAQPGHAQEFSALARVETSRSFIRDAGLGISVQLQLSQPVPFRLFTLDSPPRLVVDFREVNWDGVVANDLRRGRNTLAVRFGGFRPGWSRLVLDLATYQAVELAGMSIDPGTGVALVDITTIAIDQQAFLSRVGAPDGAGWDLPIVADVPQSLRRQTGDGPLVVALDPGHGGLDPGAERDDEFEADLMLQFARELKETLLRAGGFLVVMTREEDIFVPLETRVSLARAAGADVFLSLHADALAKGQASGAKIYTLSDTASDLASKKLAERHDRADLLAGVDLSEQDDVIASVLMDLVRLETAPRADRLADQLVTELTLSLGVMHKRPRLSAGFSVLKAPDIPSVLIELGFLSNPEDLAKIMSPDWRRDAALGIRRALQSWAVQDAAEAQLVRR